MQINCVIELLLVHFLTTKMVVVFFLYKMGVKIIYLNIHMTGSCQWLKKPPRQYLNGKLDSLASQSSTK